MNSEMPAMKRAKAKAINVISESYLGACQLQLTIPIRVANQPDRYRHPHNLDKFQLTQLTR